MQNNIVKCYDLCFSLCGNKMLWYAYKFFVCLFVFTCSIFLFTSGKDVSWTENYIYIRHAGYRLSEHGELIYHLSIAIVH